MTAFKGSVFMFHITLKFKNALFISSLFFIFSEQQCGNSVES